MRALANTAEPTDLVSRLRRVLLRSTSIANAADLSKMRSTGSRRSNAGGSDARLSPMHADIETELLPDLPFSPSWTR